VFVITLLLLAAVDAPIAPPIGAQTPVVHQIVPVGESALIVPAESSLIGTIDRFEEPARRLTLQTKDGTKVSFVVADDATIRMGPQKLAVHDLSSHHGRKAKVRFTEVNGRRTAHWVAISSDPPRGA
jgi:hypothetical protein